MKFIKLNSNSKYRLYYCNKPLFGYYENGNHRTIELGLLSLHWDTKEASSNFDLSYSIGYR